jgi:hypothetical protein
MLEKIYIKGDELMTRNIAGETLVVPIKSRVGDLDSIYTLNDVGSRIWQMLDGRVPVQAIVETISAEYDVAETDATQDVLELIGTMEEAGLIKSVTESAAA